MSGARATASAGPAARIDGQFANILLALLVGGVAFLAVVGAQVLDVTNMRWLAQTDDSFTHYLGWEFFRRSALTWPPGLNPDYGLQFSSSIMFSDSVPLLAIPLKLVSPLLPQVFQYTGWWILICFLLQAYFAVRIAALFTRSVAVTLALAVLLTLAPPLLWRLSVHFSLVAHWLVLASIYLYWAPSTQRRGLHWTILLGASALIHTYFLAMCLPIWLASIVRRRLLDGRSAPPWGIEPVAVLATVIGALWFAGFFPLRASMLSSGFGDYCLNVLSLFNPEGGMNRHHWQWSSMLPALPNGHDDYEGFAYAGLGGLAAIGLALPLLVTERRFYVGRFVWPLAIAALLLTLFALSPNLTIGDRVIRIPIPHVLFELASSVRSSGRFFWPVYYLLFIASTWLLHRGLGPRVAGPLLLALAALQIYDTYPGWSSLRPRLEVEGTTLPTSIDDQRLAQLATHYQAVRSLPAGNELPKWDQVSYFAWRQHLPTDSVYLARPDEAGYAAYMDGIDATIAQQRLSTDSLYFLDRQYASKVGGHMGVDDAMFRVGEFYVFAPGWRSFGIATTLPQSRPWSPM